MTGRSPDEAEQLDLRELLPGDVVHTIGGSRARVKLPTEDGEWIAIEYLYSDDGAAAGDDLLHRDDVSAVEPRR